jgi:hypothetical protein
MVARPSKASEISRTGETQPVRSKSGDARRPARRTGYASVAGRHGVRVAQELQSRAQGACQRAHNSYPQRGPGGRNHCAPGDEVMARKWRSDLELRRASSCHDGISDCHRLYTMAPLAAAASPLFGLLLRPSPAVVLLLRKPLNIQLRIKNERTAVCR